MKAIKTLLYCKFNVFNICNYGASLKIFSDKRGNMLIDLGDDANTETNDNEKNGSTCCIMMIAFAFKIHFWKLVSQELLENIVPLHHSMMWLFVISIFLKLVMSAPYEQGQPGGEWTAGEIDIVRGKVIAYFSILL